MLRRPRGGARRVTPDPGLMHHNGSTLNSKTRSVAVRGHAVELSRSDFDTSAARFRPTVSGSRSVLAAGKVRYRPRVRGAWGRRFTYERKPGFGLTGRKAVVRLPDGPAAGENPGSWHGFSATPRRRWSPGFGVSVPGGVRHRPTPPGTISVSRPVASRRPGPPSSRRCPGGRFICLASTAFQDEGIPRAAQRVGPGGSPLMPFRARACRGWRGRRTWPGCVPGLSLVRVRFPPSGAGRPCRVCPRTGCR